MGFKITIQKAPKSLSGMTPIEVKGRRRECPARSGLPGLRHWLMLNDVIRERPKEGGISLRPSSIQVRLESIVALCAGILGILTIFWRDWIEALTGWDPDQHNGTVEWIVVVGLLATAVTMGLAARRHWKLQTQVPGK
jgi:hypothetical protein